MKNSRTILFYLLCAVGIAVSSPPTTWDQEQQIVRQFEKVSHESCPQTSYLLPRENQTTDYLRVKHAIPEMWDITICGWYTLSACNGYFVSYSSLVKSNAMSLYYIGGIGCKVCAYLNGKNACVEDQYVGPDIEFHMCAAIHAGTGKVYIYKNGDLYHIIHNKNRDKIPGGGIFILGQDQDSLGGSFEAKQAFSGQIDNFMMWDSILDESEIRKMSESKCYCSANYALALISDNVQIYGAATMPPVSDCEEYHLPEEKQLL